MSEKNGDNTVGETTVNVAQFSTMGNLFVKEDVKTEDSKNGALDCDRLTSPTNVLKTDHDYNFKFFNKVTNQSVVHSEGEEAQVLDSEKVILNAFLNEVRNAKPAPLKNWSALHHYIYFIYRHVISSKPSNSNEIFPYAITKKIRDLVESLLQEDVTQLCIRLISLIREFAIVTRGHFNSFQFQKVTAYLVSLMSYYSAFCSAASKLAPLLTEFDFIIMERFNINWLCLNKGIFYHYVYLSPSVQAKIPLFCKLKEENKPVHKNLLESYSCFLEDMSLLASRWTSLRMRISSLSANRARSNPGDHLLNDWLAFEEYKKILKTNYWMIRNTRAMQLQDKIELDANILSLVGDTSYIADFLIDSQGNCMCEECLAAEFKLNTMNPIVASPFQPQTSSVCRVITCYICQEPIALDALASHVVTKHHESPSQKPTRVYLTPHQKRLFCPKKSKLGDLPKSKSIFPLEGLFEKNMDLKESILKIVNGSVLPNFSDSSDMKNKIEDLKHKPASSSRSGENCSTVKSTSPIFQTSTDSAKEPIFKIASEAPIMQNGTEASFSAASKTNEEISCKAAIDEYLKIRNESAKNRKSSGETNNKKVSEALKKSAELFVNKDVPKSVEEKTKQDSNVNGTTSVAVEKPQQKVVNVVDSKVLEFLKTNDQKPAASPPAKPETMCLGHACGHKCKQEEEKQTEVKKHSCQDTCDHKESRKCDCAYCEVFGSSLPPHTHKTSETRDRLRTRLNQRKEKVVESNKGNVKSAPKNDVAGVKVLPTKPTPTTNSVNGVKPNAKSNVRVPPRVPEVFHLMLPPANAKTVPDTPESKRPTPSTVTNSEQKPVINRVPAPSAGCEDIAISRPVSSLSTSSLSSFESDMRDINELLKYIEGNKTVDKAVLAQKKAAKKDRQRVKKVQEKERIEEERRRQEELILKEEKRKEEERRKAEALAKQLLEKQKKNKKVQDDGKKQDSKKNKKKGKSNDSNKKQESKSNLIEETIPAMVTIKRVAEGDDSPATVTITLKGSTPESDQLLFTLVNGHNNGNKEQTTPTVNADKGNKSKNNTSQANTNKSDNDKKKNKKNKKEEVQVQKKEVKVTISVDKNNVTKKESKKKQNKVIENAKSVKPVKNTKGSEQKVSNQELDLPMLRLPPGITITKIESPPTKPNKSCSASAPPGQNPTNSSVPVSKSGVIVVDTEKLIQQSITASNNKKNKKKNKKRDPKNENSQPEPQAQNSMVTLKNPIFHTLQTGTNNKPTKNTETAIYSNSQQASIFKNENGMVTIRSPRLQNPFENGSPISNFLSDLKPMFGPEVSTPFPVCHTAFSSDSKRNSSFNAEEILSGLPGIEITKVDKVEPHRFDKLQSSQAAEISIIPTNNCSSHGDKFNFDKEDWTYESVFTPRDEGEDMDADERELEAFKRFCQQSVPPERKEKVAHLNVKDIVLKKKNDVTYS